MYIFQIRLHEWLRPEVCPWKYCVKYFGSYHASLKYTVVNLFVTSKAMILILIIFMVMRVIAIYEQKYYAVKMYLGVEEIIMTRLMLNNK
jgi:hypothetical protein